MLHTNSLIVWLLLGFFGAAYFLIPEESEREIHSPMLAYLQLAILVIGTLGVVLTYFFNLFEGNFLLGREGREFLEQPKWVKAGIVVAALIFLFNVTMTVLKGKKTAISNSASGSLGSGAAVPLRLLQPFQSGTRQTVLVVCRPSVGRGRVGAHHGIDPRVLDAEAHGR
jgi:nitric oxide reductase large subunit